jgi:GNAT superfamily N-acetyltransferase
MPIAIRDVGPNALSLYAQVSIAFRVESVFRVELVEDGLGGILLREERVTPYIKDYDADVYGPSVEDRPADWPHQFDVRNWGFFLALDSERPVGGAAVAFNTSGVHILEGRGDLSVLWDIRVHPDLRGQGIGTRLFRRAAEWSREQGCKQMKIETQNVNVRACRFYAAQGCRLGCIDRYAYAGNPAVAHEVMLLWYLDL